MIPPLLQLVLLPFFPSSLRANNVDMVDAKMEKMREEKQAAKETKIGMDSIFQYYVSFFVENSDEKQEQKLLKPSAQVE